MATTQHHIWAFGHFILLLSSLRYLMAWALFRGPAAWYYQFGLLGALMSYAIVCHKSLGIPQPSPTWIKKAVFDENVQYFLLAAFWWYTTPIAIALLPYAIFSLFHTLTFTRTTLFPQFFPPGPPATAGGQPTPHPIAKKIHMFVKSNYNPAMKAVSFIELAIMARVTLGVFVLSNSLITPILYAHFLRQRYYQSAFTREAVAFVNLKVDEFVKKPGNPPAALHFWNQFKGYLARWVGTTLQPAGARAQ